MDIKLIKATAPYKGMEEFTLYTFVVEVPYYIWAELLTHKRMARNASSNRAMKVEKNIGLGFYLPEVFYEKGNGMSSGNPLPEDIQKKAKEIWEDVWNKTMQASIALDELGVSKEQASRVLPTFKIMKGIITGTKRFWKTFLKLRDHPTADNAMQTLAKKIKTEIENPLNISYSTLHAPFELLTEKGFSREEKARIWAARIARISYMGEGDIEKDIKLGERLYFDGHLSPFEHTAEWKKSPAQSAVFSFDDIKNWKENVGDLEPIFGWENDRALLEKTK